MYFFVLGSNTAISIAELYAVFEDGKFRLANNNILLLEKADDIKSADLIKRLGGTIKIGEIVSSLPIDNYSKKINRILLDALMKISKPGTKLNYGISVYGKINLDVKRTALEIKKDLRLNKVSCRWVQAKEKALTSVQVQENRMTKDGAEIVLFADKDNLHIGLTETVQPFKELSYRDYNRPGRDDLSGMLPPKLAQVMINLAKVPAEGKLLDPFCGSGTILTEAILMGYKDLFGSDISEKAVSDTKKNIDWVKNKFNLSGFSATVLKISSTELSAKFEPGSIDGVAAEPYLGPQRGKVDPVKIVKELGILYSKTIDELSKILKQNGRVVMIWPVLTSYKKNIFLNPDINDFSIANPLPRELAELLQRGDSNPGLTNRNTLLYGRPGQKVWREIVVMKK